MLAKNTRTPVAAVTVALIIGLVVALWVALMPAPAQAQAGDELQLLKLKAKTSKILTGAAPSTPKMKSRYTSTEEIWGCGTISMQERS